MSNTKSLGVMQPYIFPYIGYFQLVNAVDKFVFLDDVNFIKKGWIHRNNILLDGQASLFSVPVAKASQNSLIMDLNVSEAEDWRKKLWTKMEHAYKKAPHFESRMELLQEIFALKEGSISTFASNSVIKIAGELGIETTFVPSSSAYPKEHYGAQRILEICKEENASQYINPQGGLDLYDKEMFSAENIELNFLFSNEISYKQFGKHDFAPNLSIIDVLMFNSNEQVLALLTQYELK